MAHYLVAALLDLAFGIFSLSKIRNRVTIAFFLTSVSIAAWTFELFLLSWLTDQSLLSTLFHLFRIGMFLIPPSIALTTWYVLGRRSPAFFKTTVLPGFVVAITLGLSNLLVWPSELQPVASGYLPKPDLIYYLFAANLTWCLGSAMIYCIWAFGVVTEREKLKIKWLLITLASTLLAALAATALMNSEFYLAKSIGILPNLVFVGLLAYATIEHNLMDFRTALGLGIAKALSLLFFSAGFLSLLSAFDTGSGLHTTFLAAVLFAFFLEIYPRSTSWLRSKTYKLLAACPYDTDDLKKTVATKLNFCNSNDDLKSILDYFFYHALKVNTYSLYEVRTDPVTGGARLHSFEDPANQVRIEDHGKLGELATASRVTMIDETTGELRDSIESNKAISCFPVLVKGRVAALMFVGKPQSDSSIYRFEEFKLLEWLMLELAYTLERIDQLNKLQNELGEAKKQLSLLGLMNDYHHDIKAPLSIIDGVVSNDLYDDQRRKEVILQQVAWGSELIATMARLLKGNRSRKVERVQLNEVVADCCAIFQKTKTEIITHLKTTGEIAGDSDDLKIMLINMLKNAVEAARVSPKLQITVESYSDDDYTYLVVSDNGKGMPRDVLANLWQNCFSTKVNGSGIGLQAIKRIADEHEARVSVFSEPDVGSSFKFRFPNLQL